MIIHTIPVLPFGMLNAFLLVNGQHSVLVDTGLPNRSDATLNAIKSAGIDLQKLSAVVITHAHVDHAGGTHDLRKHTSAPIYAHRQELPYLLQKCEMVFQPTDWFGHIFAKTGLIQTPYPPLVPDVIVDGESPMSLSHLGIPGHLLWTPGHTPGSLSLVLDTGDVLAGDLVASGILLGGIACRNRPKQPPFEENSDQVASSLKRLLDIGCHRFYLGHGGPISAEAVKRHVERLSQIAVGKLH